jgi:hypothetical protein
LRRTVQSSLFRQWSHNSRTSREEQVFLRERIQQQQKSGFPSSLAAIPALKPFCSWYGQAKFNFKLTFLYFYLVGDVKIPISEFQTVFVLSERLVFLVGRILSGYLIRFPIITLSSTCGIMFPNCFFDRL